MFQHQSHTILNFPPPIFEGFPNNPKKTLSVSLTGIFYLLSFSYHDLSVITLWFEYINIPYLCTPDDVPKAPDPCISFTSYPLVEWLPNLFSSLLFSLGSGMIKLSQFNI